MTDPARIKHSGPETVHCVLCRSGEHERVVDPVDDLLMQPDKQPLMKNGRYWLPHPETGKWQSWTRATNFAPTLSDRFALSEWELRMALVGATLRPDLVAEATGLDVKTDREKLNRIVKKLKRSAGGEEAADRGTRMHTHTEVLDGGGTLDRAPVKERPDVLAYRAALKASGVEVFPHLIERVTAIPELGVAGKLDRVLRLADGTYAIGDVKGLALTERIPTPSGWTTMKDVVVGDRVFDAYGEVCRVTAKSEAKRIGTYIVRFDDGSSVVCDTEHIWWTAAGLRPGTPTAKSIEEVRATLVSSQGQKHHRVPVAGPLNLPDADLPVDPYLLGCWLGDGTAKAGSITKGSDLFEILESDGHRLGLPKKCHSDKCVTRTVLGLVTQLRELGVLDNKHIPEIYLRASVPQRLRLLQGLLDTDGTWNTARKTAVFYSTDKALALQTEELLLSLGQRPCLAGVRTKGFGKQVMCYHVEFTPVDLNPFRLPRKADQAAASKKPLVRSRRRLIVSVDPGPDVDTACIAVDSSTRTYLCGDRMIPTHNTPGSLDYKQLEIAIQLALYAHGVNASGLWNPGEERWEPGPEVRTDIGIVMHMPYGKAVCTLYEVPLDGGWEDAALSGTVRKRRSRKVGFKMLGEPVSVPEPTWEERFAQAGSRAALSSLFQAAVAAGLSEKRLQSLVKIGQERLASLGG